MTLDSGQGGADCPHWEQGNVWITNDASAPCDRCGGTGRAALHELLAAELARLRSIIDRPDPHDFMAASEVEARFQLDKWGTAAGFPTAFNSTADSDFVYLIAYLVGKVAATPDENLDKKLHRITTIAGSSSELARGRESTEGMNHLPQGVDVTTRVGLELHAALRHRAKQDHVSEQVVQRRAMARYVWPVDHVDREGHWPADVMRDGGGW